jgi:hypothetical protein
MMKSIALVVLSLVVLIGCKKDTAQKENTTKNEEQAISVEKQTPDFSITPISHATAVFTLNSTVFYIDPVGGKEDFENQPEPSIILVTDIYGDHFDLETASEGVLAFEPKKVYHYRGQGGLSDVERFKALVNAKNPSINVELLNWYPQMD